MMLTQLPESWAWKKIGDIADTTSGGTPSRKKPEYFGGFIKWIKSGELGDAIVRECEETISESGLSNSSAKVFPKGTVLVALYGATVGKTAILDIDAATNQAVCAVFPKNQSFTAKYIFYWFQLQRQYLMSISSGGAQPNISQNIIRSLDFPLAPLPEQERIVARIEELFSRLDAGVAALKRAQAALKRYRASVLKAACEGSLWGYSEPGDNGLPKGWQKRTVGEVAESMKNGIYKSAEFYSDDGIACLRMYNIDAGKIIWKNIKRMLLTQEEIDTYGLSPGDILINRVNSRELVGKAAVIPDNIETTVYESKNIRLVIKRDVINSQFLSYCFSALGHHYFNFNAQQVVGMASINQTQIAQMSIPLPPLSEQARIVAEVERRLSVVEELEVVTANALARAARLRQAILKRAFEGRLVSPDAV